MIIEAWFFLMTLNGTGKAIQVVGPFYTQHDCVEIQKQAGKPLGTWSTVTACWRGPVVVSK